MTSSRHYDLRLICLWMKGCVSWHIKYTSHILFIFFRIDAEVREKTAHMFLEIPPQCCQHVFLIVHFKRHLETDAGLSCFGNVLLIFWMFKQTAEKNNIVFCFNISRKREVIIVILLFTFQWDNQFITKQPVTSVVVGPHEETFISEDISTVLCDSLMSVCYIPVIPLNTFLLQAHCCTEIYSQRRQWWIRLPRWWEQNLTSAETIMHEA